MKTMGFYYTLIKMAIIKQTNNTKSCRDVVQLELSLECKLGQPLWKSVLQYLLILNTYTTPETEILYILMYVCNIVCINVFKRNTCILPLKDIYKICL